MVRADDLFQEREVAAYKTNFYVVYELSLRYRYVLEDRRWLDLSYGLWDCQHIFVDKGGGPVAFEKGASRMGYYTEVVVRRVERRRLLRLCKGFL